MAKTWCLVKKGARALVGVPSLFKEGNNAEYIGFNAGRIYGSIQIPHLFANWGQGIYYHWLIYPGCLTYLYNTRHCIITFCLVYTEAMDQWNEGNVSESIDELKKDALRDYGNQPIYILEKM